MPNLVLCNSPDELKTAIDNGIRASRRAFQSFLDLPAETSDSELLTAFNRITASLNGWAQQAEVFQSVHPDPGMQAMGAVLEQQVHAFQSELSLHRDVYERLLAIELPAEASFVERRFLERSLRDFKRSGVDQDPAGRERVRLLQEELLAIGQEFDKNIVESSVSMTVEGGHAALGGMPEDFLAAHPEDERGHVQVSTDSSDFVPVQLYCKDGSVRRKLAEIWNNRAYPENLTLLDSLLAKRRELAVQLGYADWADYVTDDKMIGSGKAAADFLETVVERATDLAKQQYQELLEAKRKDEPDAKQVDVSDVKYFTECVMRETFAFDSQSVRPYLGYKNVESGILDIASELYGIQFVLREDLDAWHPDVSTYDVLEGERTIGRFYLDMFPRPGKYKHAAVMDVRDGVAAGDGHGEVLPEAALVCNFAKPTTGPNNVDAGADNGLMLHAEVITFFHEFGHLMHHMLSGKQRYFGFGGFGVEWDFVEVPSQLFEEWAWDHKVLSKFAFHETTGEPIPSELVERMRNAAGYGKGLKVVFQMWLATLSLEFHRRDPKTLDTTALMRELRPRMTFIEELEGTHFQASFGHLNGYSAIYYTYMWSLVIAKDMWSAFEGNPMDSDIAMSYRQKVLAKGGALDASDQIRDFLGRDYNFQAWERWLGV